MITTLYKLFTRQHKRRSAAPVACCLKTAPLHFRRALLSKEINMLCNEKGPWADWFLLRATACCLQAPAGAAGQLPQLWLLHHWFIECSLKALIVLMLLTICCRFPRWTFSKYFLHTQFDSRGELRPLLAGASAQHWHVYLKLSDSSLCLPFGDFKWNWPSFTNRQFWTPPFLRQKLTVLTPVHLCSQTGLKTVGPTGCFQQRSSKFCCILALHYTSLPDWFSCESRRTRKLIGGVFCKLVRLLLFFLSFVFIGPGSY